MKKSKYQIIICVIITMTMVLLTACASIMAGGNPDIIIEGDGIVDEPVNIATDIKVYQNVKLPAIVKVDRHGIDGKRIAIKSQNYIFEDIVLQKKLEGWTWGNIAFGGLPGLLIDLGWNSVSKPKERRFEIKARRKTGDELFSYNSINSIDPVEQEKFRVQNTTLTRFCSKATVGNNTYKNVIVSLKSREIEWSWDRERVKVTIISQKDRQIKWEHVFQNSYLYDFKDGTILVGAIGVNNVSIQNVGGEWICEINK